MAKLSQALGSDFNSLPISEQSKMVKTAPQARQAELSTIDQQTKASESLAEKEGALQVTGAQEKVKALEGYSKEEKDLVEASRKEREKFPYPEFHPTKDNAQDLMELFSVINVVGMAMGASGKNNALGAMKSMTGMMKGYREGRKDLFEKEKVEFDKNFQAMKTKHEEIAKDLEQSLKLSSTDKEKALAIADVAVAKSGSPILKEKARIQGMGEAIKYWDNVGRDLQASQDKVEQRAFDLKKIEMEHKYRLEEERIKNENKLMGTVGDVPSYIKNFTGSSVSKKDAPEIMTAANALGDAYAITETVKDHPEWVGRSGQIKNVFNRYIESLETGAPTPEDNGQPELIFAKRYAEYLVNYERALAGGARGFTVSFQNRFNKLLEQNQFNATGMTQLMDEQIRTITAKAAEKGATINRENLTKMAYDIKSRSGDEYAIKGLNNVISVGGGSPSPAPGQDMQSAAIKNFGKYEPEKYTYGYENGKFYRDSK